jgi:hypothetical protein
MIIEIEIEIQINSVQLTYVMTGETSRPKGHY